VLPKPKLNFEPCKFEPFSHRQDVPSIFIRIRDDRGTETGKMATIHLFLLNRQGIMDDPTDSIIYGPSTINKRLEKFFKEQLTALLRGREYDPHVALDRQLLALSSYQLSNRSVIYLSTTGILIEFNGKIN